jgi:hypothetical protein
MAYMRGTKLGPESMNVAGEEAPSVHAHAAGTKTKIDDMAVLS